MNVRQVLKQLDDIQKKQIPFATIKALNSTAEFVAVELRKEMKRVFENPTPYTLNALRVKYAKKQKLEAYVWFKTDAGKGTPADIYLPPSIYGGERKMKRFEKALQSAGILPAGMFAVPAEGADMDAYGNMSRSQIIQILSYLQAFGEQGYRANMSAARRERMKYNMKAPGIEYFVVRPGTRNLLPGVWKRVSFGAGKAIKPILIFIKKPVYQQRFKFFEVGNRAANKVFAQYFRESMDYALRTAR